MTTFAGEAECNHATRELAATHGGSSSPGTLKPEHTWDYEEPTVYQIESEEERVRLTLARFHARTGSLHGFWPVTRLETRALAAILKARPHLGVPTGYQPDNIDMDKRLANLREHRRQAILDGIEARYLHGIENDPELSILGSSASEGYSNREGQLETSFFEEAFCPMACHTEEMHDRPESSVAHELPASSRAEIGEQTWISGNGKVPDASTIRTNSQDTTPTVP